MYDYDPEEQAENRRRLQEALAQFMRPMAGTPPELAAFLARGGRPPPGMPPRPPSMGMGMGGPPPMGLPNMGQPPMAPPIAPQAALAGVSHSKWSKPVTFEEARIEPESGGNDNEEAWGDGEDDPAPNNPLFAGLASLLGGR